MRRSSFVIIGAAIAISCIANTSNAAFVELLPGEMPSWDADLRFIEYGDSSSAGHVDFNFVNDSVANVETMLSHASSVNVGPDTGLTQIAKSNGAAGGFSYTGLGTTSGTWSYTGAFDVLYVVVKAGSNERFALYELKSPYVQGSIRPWSTENISTGVGNVQPNLSHLSFYGTVVPEPGSMAALASLAVVGLVWRRRRQASAA